MTKAFLPGARLGKLDDMKDKMPCHDVAASGAALTVQKEGGTYKWRTLSSHDEDGWGEGSREQFRAWLSKE